MDVAGAREPLLRRLTQFLSSRLADGPPIGPLEANTSLIQSGLVDSLALVDLLSWIETEIGAPLDATAIDDLKSADTLGAIGDLILAVRRRARPDLPTRAEREPRSSPFGGTVVTYQPGMRAEVLALQVHHWGNNHRGNEHYLRWKYEENPYQREPLIYLARVGQRAVGMRGFYGSEWEGARGQRLRTVCAGDLVVHPAYRSRGVIPKLMEHAMADLKARGFRHVLSLSAGLVTRVASLALGWRGIGSLDLVTWRRPGQAAAGGAFDRLDAMAGHGAGAVRAESPDPPALAELVSRMGHDGRLRHVRTPEYFAWRLANPRSTYRVLTWREKRVEGYLVLAAPADGRAGVRLLDWEARTASIRAALLRAAMEWGDFAEVTTWSATLPGDARQILRETGFTGASPPPHLRMAAQKTLLIKDLADADGGCIPWVLNGQSLLDLDRWDLRMLYSDGM